MQNQKENVFEKFRLLNSQENTEEIHWSSSSFSDNENYANNDKPSKLINRNRCMKRKRKTKVQRNTSNLNITVIEGNLIEVPGKALVSGKVNFSPVSPILVQSQRFPLQKSSSPILTSKSIQCKSPFIILNSESPKCTPKIRKQLFDIRDTCKDEEVCGNKSIEYITRNDKVTIHLSDELHEGYSIKKREKTHARITENTDIFTCNLNSNKTVTQQAKLDLASKVKSFFDSHFSSGSTSQNSISDATTPNDNSETSEEIEILSCKSQIISKNNSLQSVQQDDNNTHSSENTMYDFNKKAKKVKYKKNGLAYCLNKLIKKQNAVLSLWQHERFLAKNSNFIIPKGEHTEFRIQKKCCKYGCYLLEAMDKNDEKFLILINNNYVSEDALVNDAILKLYEPYNVVTMKRGCKLIINVSKFECISFRQ